MTHSHNNVIPNVHLRKHWHNSIWTYRGVVKCHLNQHGKKMRRVRKRNEVCCVCVCVGVLLPTSQIPPLSLSFSPLLLLTPFSLSFPLGVW